MKFISYKHNSQSKFGIIDNNLITDLTGKISGADTLKDLISKNVIEASDDVHAGRLPGAAGPHDRDELAAMHGKVGATQCPDLRVAFTEHSTQPDQFNDRAFRGRLRVLCTA